MRRDERRTKIISTKKERKESRKKKLDKKILYVENVCLLCYSMLNEYSSMSFSSFFHINMHAEFSLKYKKEKK